MNCIEKVRKEIKLQHPEIELNNKCTLGIIKILKNQCPHFNKDFDESNCKCDPCECDPCKC